MGDLKGIDTELNFVVKMNTTSYQNSSSRSMRLPTKSMLEIPRSHHFVWNARLISLHACRIYIPDPPSRGQIIRYFFPFPIHISFLIRKTLWIFSLSRGLLSSPPPSSQQANTKPPHGRLLASTFFPSRHWRLRWDKGLQPAFSTTT